MCWWATEDVGQHSQGWPSSTIRSSSSWPSVMESWLICHFVWPGSGSANMDCDGSRCCTCLGGSWSTHPGWKPIQVQIIIIKNTKTKQFQVTSINTNNLHQVMWFQVFLLNTNYFKTDLFNPELGPYWGYHSEPGSNGNERMIPHSLEH